MRTAAVNRAREQAGVTLVELLVVMTMLTIVLAALVRPLFATTDVASRDQARSTAVMDAQAGLYRMTKEVRQAQTIYSATSTSLDFSVRTGGATQRVLYDCGSQPSGSSYRQCLRAVSANLAQAPSSSNGAAVIARVLNGTTSDPSDPVFTYTPSSSAPTYVAIHLVVPSSAGQKPGYSYRVVLDDGAYLPNQGTQ